MSTIPVKFQNQSAHVRNNKVRVNGHTLQANAVGVVESDVPDVIHKLRRQPGWTEIVGTGENGAVLVKDLIPGGAVLTATPSPLKPSDPDYVHRGGFKEFLELVDADTALGEHFWKLRSIAGRVSLASNLGFTFDPQELALYIEARNPVKEVPNPEPKKVEPLPELPPITPETVAMTTSLKIPDVTKGEEWPDPTPEMDRQYLQAMAAAYEVPWTKRVTTTELVRRIKLAMYEDDSSASAS